jgi:hypothetical protein
MTVLEATAQLYQWFSENDSFIMEEDFIKIIIVTDHPKRDRAAFLSALGQLDAMEFVDCSITEDVKYWTLRKSFASFVQNVEISPELAETISGIVNKFCEISGDNKNICNPANINEEDIKNVIFIANLALQEKLIDRDEE